MKFETLAIHAGEEPNLAPGGFGDVTVPIHLATTFARKKLMEPTGGYAYARAANPTRDALETRLAALEGGKYGLAFGSGMAAESTLCLAVLRAGDRVVAFDDLYGGTRRLFDLVLKKIFPLTIEYVDATDLGRVEAALRQKTRMVWVESPTNPLMRMCDIAGVAAAARRAGALCVVDNTFMTPCFQRPLSLGADVVLHSTTKYLNGHSDSVGGAIVLSSEALHEQVRFAQKAVGAILAPFDSYLVLRGTKTLSVRMRAHQANAQKIAAFLKAHPKVEKVFYPGLKSHPQHALAKQQATGFGGMLSFDVRGGLPATEKFLEGLSIIALAESLGGVESLIGHPATMTHASLSREEREKTGITDSLVRLSVGIEDADDLVEDLSGALNRL